MAPPIQAIRWDGQEVDTNGAPVGGVRLTITKSDGNPATVWADLGRTRVMPYVNTRRDGSWTAWLDPGIYSVQAAGGTANSIFVAEGAQTGNVANLVADGTMLFSGETTMLRRDVSNATATLTSGTMLLAYFTAAKTETITQFASYSGGTAAAATPTLCRAGVYAVAADGSGALVASIANDTTLWASTSTKYTRVLSAPWQKVAGQRYAAALLCVTSFTAPTVMGGPTTLPSTDYFDDPRLSAQITGQSDLPATFTASAPASLARAGLYLRFYP